MTVHKRPAAIERGQRGVLHLQHHVDGALRRRARLDVQPGRRAGDLFESRHGRAGAPLVHRARLRLGTCGHGFLLPHGRVQGRSSRRCTEGPQRDRQVGPKLFARRLRSYMFRFLLLLPAHRTHTCVCVCVCVCVLARALALPQLHRCSANVLSLGLLNVSSDTSDAALQTDLNVCARVHSMAYYDGYNARGDTDGSLPNLVEVCVCVYLLMVGADMVSPHRLISQQWKAGKA